MLLHIKNLSIPVSIGAYEWERHHPRRLRLDVWAEYDGNASAASDLLADAVDYAALERHVIAAAQSRHFALLEALISAVGEAVLEHPQVERVTVEVEKTGVLAHAESAVLRETFHRG